MSVTVPVLFLELEFFLLVVVVLTVARLLSKEVS